MEYKNKQAVIVLHEIYGINEFIKNVCQKLRDAGHTVFCPSMTGGLSFSDDEPEEAYSYFMEHGGFDVSEEMSQWIRQLKGTYEKVTVMGFSVGATIAWRCCESLDCSSIIACYGSRIRDYTNLDSVCPTLLLFAAEDSFDVHSVACQLQRKENVKILVFDAVHLSFFNGRYNFMRVFYTCIMIQRIQWVVRQGIVRKEYPCVS